MHARSDRKESFLRVFKLAGARMVSAASFYRPAVVLLIDNLTLSVSCEVISIFIREAYVTMRFAAHFLKTYSITDDE